MNEQLRALLQDTVDGGLYQMILSNPRKRGEDFPFKVKIRPVMIKEVLLFQETVYQGTKVFHENCDGSSLIDRIEERLTQEFRQCEVEHKTCRAVVLVSKKGRMTVSRKQTVQNVMVQPEEERRLQMSHNRVKRYILEGGIPVPFLIDLGVQTGDGKIVRARYDKFRQINRFLEFIEDILPTLPKEETVRILDFGCGKSYLTFAMYYYLHCLKEYDVEITGLDLKEDVIDNCNQLAAKYGYEKLHFCKGNIADYKMKDSVDMVVTLHACDTATDYALEKAVRWNAKIIMSVPCCQHEVNRQIQNKELASVLQYGIIKERMSALITDAVRAQLLEAQGYDTNILEFIDMEHTPKNLLIRAVRRPCGEQGKKPEKMMEVVQLAQYLQIEPTLLALLGQ